MLRPLRPILDGLPALALALEPTEHDIMQRTPRPPREPVLTWQRGTTLIYHGSLITAAVLVGFWWVLAGDLNNTPVARNTAFVIAAYSQLAYALVCRRQRFTLPRLGLFSNPWLLAAFALSDSLRLAVLTLPFAQELFDVAPYHTLPWSLIVALRLLLRPSSCIASVDSGGARSGLQIGSENAVPQIGCARVVGQVGYCDYCVAGLAILVTPQLPGFSVLGIGGWSWGILAAHLLGVRMIFH